MFRLIPNTKDMIQEELEIMNSNPQYNMWASDKPRLDEEDILKEYGESEQLGSTRWLVQYEDAIIGIIDYLPKNPKDGMPWIGLFVIHKNFHGKGLASRIYDFLETKLKRDFSHEEIRLAILKKNEPGIRFWRNQRFEKYNEGLLDGREIERWRKVLKG